MGSSVIDYAFLDDVLMSIIDHSVWSLCSDTRDLKMPAEKILDGDCSAAILMGSKAIEQTDITNC